MPYHYSKSEMKQALKAHYQSHKATYITPHVLEEELLKVLQPKNWTKQSWLAIQKKIAQDQLSWLEKRRRQAEDAQIKKP